MCVLSIKVPIRKKSRNLFNDPRMCNQMSCGLFKNNVTNKVFVDKSYIYIYIYIYI